MDPAVFFKRIRIKAFRMCGVMVEVIVAIIPYLKSYFSKINLTSNKR